MTMMNTRWAPAALLGLLIASCGGGGGNSFAIVPPGNDGPSAGGACDNDYYQEIIGTYSGTIFYDVTGISTPLLRSCRWEMTARVEIDRELAVCSLRMDTDSSVTQDIVLANDDPQRYQCLAEQSVRNLRDPNQSSSPSRFDDVTFPVLMNVQSDPSSPRRGPYFGDLDLDAEHVQLFDGPVFIVDGIRFNGSNGIELFQTSPSSEESLSGVLIKE